MKRLLLTLITVILISGCAAVQIPKVTESATAGMGDVFFSDTKPLVSKYELVVTKATTDTLSLAYNEYYQDTTTYQWLIKSGFNKNFDYDLKESKTVNFKALSFEVLEVNSGVVSYRRTK